MNIISSKITEALEFCALAHKDQKRKKTEIPFASHPSSVGFILHSSGYGEEVVIAGILHDVIEDTIYSEIDIKNKFDENVMNLVKGVTEDVTIKTWKGRKDDYLNRVSNSNDDVKAICAADLLDNCRAMVRSLENGLNIWEAFSESRETLINYYKKRLSIVEKNIKPELAMELEKVILELEKFLV